MSVLLRSPLVRGLCAAVVLALAVLPARLGALEPLSANDLEAATLSEALALDGYTILATAGKTVVIEALTSAKTADDGEIFNARIKLGGAGSTDFRAVKFSTGATSTLKVYLNSSSKTDPRILKVMDEAGTVVAELTAPVDVETGAGMATVYLPFPGTWFLTSANGGINLYLIVVE